MKTRVNGPAMKKWTVIFVMLFAMTVFLVPITQAADEVAGRAVFHTLKVELKEVGDVPGHMTGVGQQSGLLFVTKGPDSGQIATRMNTFQFDTVNEKGTSTNDIVYTYPDGSTQSLKAVGTIAPADGGKRAVFEGTHEVTGGTGRFAGMKGKGTYKG
jgi:hypothetical protein